MIVLRSTVIMPLLGGKFCGYSWQITRHNKVHEKLQIARIGSILDFMLALCEHGA